MGRGDGGVSRVRSFVRSIDRIKEDGRTGIAIRAREPVATTRARAPATGCT